MGYEIPVLRRMCRASSSCGFGVLPALQRMCGPAAQRIDLMANLLIQLSKNGVDKVRAGASTIAESIELGQLIEASAVGLRLLDQSIVEHFEGKAAADAETAVVDEPSVLVKTDIDGLLDVPRRIKVQVGTLPRDPYDAPPAWFVEGCKNLFPKE